MKHLTKRFHKWYDTLNEPWRFVILLVLLIPAIALLYFTDDDNYAAAIGSGTYIMVLVYDRRNYILGKHNE